MRVLVTGMSGAGKSAVIALLRRQGRLAFDVDDGLTDLDPRDGRWHQRTVDVQRVLELGDASTVFIAG